MSEFTSHFSVFYLLLSLYWKCSLIRNNSVKAIGPECADYSTVMLTNGSSSSQIQENKGLRVTGRWKPCLHHVA